jgi:hypothetical protein
LKIADVNADVMVPNANMRISNKRALVVDASLSTLTVKSWLFPQLIPPLPTHKNLKIDKKGLATLL